MGGIAGPLQQAVNTAGQAMGQVGGQIQQLGSPIGQAVGQSQQGGLAPFGGPSVGAPYAGTIGGRGPSTPFTLPSHYQSPYANYGFDPALQSYLDRQNYMSNNDAGVAFQYNPTNQTFTGGTMGGQYNPIPLSVMQQAAGGNRDVMAPYFQSRFPQPTGPAPTIKPGMPQFPIQPGPNVDPVRPNSFPRFGGNAVRGNPNQGGYNPQQPRPIGFEGPIGNWERLNSNMMNQPTGTSADVAAQRGPNPQRGLGGLQIDKFRSRLGQR